jgi:hypothetical protein
MAIRRLVLASMISVGIAGAIASVRAECATLSLDKELNQSLAVFVGRAATQSVLADVTPVQTETTFEVERVWKGKPDADKRLRVRTCGGTVGDLSYSCGESFKFASGTRYVVFAGGDPLMTNTCYHTAWIEEAKETLQWLSNKESRRVQ